MSGLDERESELLGLLIRQHRPNVVAEGEGINWRARVKCEGENCHFYYSGPSYWSAMDRHSAHLGQQAENFVSDVLISRMAILQTLAAALDAIPGDDPEIAHDQADRLVLAALSAEVRGAYQRLRDRCRWWATA